MTGFGNSRNGFVIVKSYTTPRGTFAVLEFREARMLVEFESGLRRELPIASTLAIDQRRDAVEGYGVDKDAGLGPLNIRIPTDTVTLRTLADALESGGLYYYLEHHVDGQLAPHFYCKTWAWAEPALQTILLDINREAHTGFADGSRDTSAQEKPWEISRVRCVYALLRAIVPYLAGEHGGTEFLEGMEQEWPILAREHGGAYRP
jgi:hypothetical protein